MLNGERVYILRGFKIGMWTKAKSSSTLNCTTMHTCDMRGLLGYTDTRKLVMTLGCNYGSLTVACDRYVGKWMNNVRDTTRSVGGVTEVKSLVTKSGSSSDFGSSNSIRLCNTCDQARSRFVC